jgi:mRNA interferase MazF
MARGLTWGDVRLVEFGRPDKTRPVLVLSRARAIEVLSAVMVAPITSTIRGNRAEVPLGTAEGLKGPSAAKLDALQTVEKKRLGRFLGSIAPERRAEIRRAVLFAMELEGESDLDG